MATEKKQSDHGRLDDVIADARRQREQREQSYREQALKLYPWVCGRCGREFTRQNLRELTVHHKDHDHDNNPADGSNWELLCIYCHDNEHARYTDIVKGGDYSFKAESAKPATHSPFAGLKNMLRDKDQN